jgi:hypothetical protein
MHRQLILKARNLSNNRLQRTVRCAARPLNRRVGLQLFRSVTSFPA